MTYWKPRITIINVKYLVIVEVPDVAGIEAVRIVLPLEDSVGDIAPLVHTPVGQRVRPEDKYKSAYKACTVFVRPPHPPGGLVRQKTPYVIFLQKYQQQKNDVPDRLIGHVNDKLID